MLFFQLNDSTNQLFDDFWSTVKGFPLGPNSDSMWPIEP